MPRSDLINAINRKHFSEFAERMSFRAREVTEAADQITEDVAREVYEELVMRTPVDTGQAKSNWIISFNRAESYTRDAFVPGRHGSTATANIFAALEHMETRLEGRPKNSIIYIQNSLRYISRLNDGYSKQAPPGFVEAAMLKGARRVKLAKVFTDIR